MAENPPRFDSMQRLRSDIFSSLVCLKRDIISSKEPLSFSGSATHNCRDVRDAAGVVRNFPFSAADHRALHGKADLSILVDIEDLTLIV